MERELASKATILVVDDSELNREFLSAILEDKYHIVEAENGLQALELMQKDMTMFSLVLLDIVMPVMDGFEVLTHMERNQWIKSLPVIMISSESAADVIDRAYEFGVTDFISRPFDPNIVQHRVANTIALYEKQRRLANMVAEQVYKREKESKTMITILSHIVEFRNGESGLHIRHIHIITDLLLKRLMERTKQYDLSVEDMSRIITASALHDIGKISIPEEVINKPGKLTKEEFEIMKRHSEIGAEMLTDLSNQQRDPLIETAYEICRWHHERYDGRGYPDGLSGEKIPISAQIVSLADVYDALTSERCYKKTFEHAKAVEMILAGECGAFNPLLLECLQDVAEELQGRLREEATELDDKKNIIKELTAEILRQDDFLKSHG